jgi:hemerythrin
VVSQLADELSKTGASIVLVGKINHSMGDWFISHIKQEDKKMAAYIEAHK